MSAPLTTLLDTGLLGAAFGVWYALAITVVALAAVAARTPERRRDAREVLKVLVRRDGR
ncbi:hypothetical protein GCM10009665_56110 [Kitasatospora nipponensis]|uniref:Heme exporter protein D n=1 Tax=Kitasatospora nipponensis TaxID=258049 RepID=A0ABP4HC20_9ACTN